MRQLKISKSITNRDSASLERFLSDISKVQMIGADEEVELARKIRVGDHQLAFCGFCGETVSEPGYRFAGSYQ